MLLHFVLVLHFAAIITFRGVTVALELVRDIFEFFDLFLWESITSRKNKE